MTIIEESNININNNIKIEDDSNISFQETSNFITNQNLNKIKSIILGLENNHFKHFIVKNEIECFYSQINNCSIKERLVLNTLINLSKLKNKKSKFLTYNDIIDKTDEYYINKNNNNYDNEEDFNIDSKIFSAVERVTHKTLHKNQIVDEKNIKNCLLYTDLNKMEFKERDNISYSNIDKLINKLKTKKNHKYLEFIAIKAIIIGIINLIEELISNYFKKSEEDINLNYNLLNEEYYFIEDDENIENNITIFKPDLFETLFKDFVFISNSCPFLENYFIESFNHFRKTYQITFTLTELFTDIFWNYIFHNKKICNKFINIYIGNDNCPENIRTTLSKIIKIISDTSIPLKSQIFQLLSINIESKDDIDLMTSIVKQKNINHNLIKNENYINNVNKNTINREYINIINNDDKNMANKNKNEVKEKTTNENDLENKTVDEVYNYINDNKEIKSKKKKRTKKKKNKKIENDIKSEDNDKNDKIIDDDLIVIQFKKDIDQNVINANEINKVKPIISDNWLKMISNY